MGGPLLVTSPSKKKSLPLTEALVFDIVDNKPRRYTSREVVGILRNRPMFRHAQSSERKGGIKWRLDLLALEKYIVQKGYQERCEERKLYDNMRNLKWGQLKKTLEVMESMNPDSLDDSYEAIATIWS